MTHQVKITLADDEYDMFLAAAKKDEEELEVYLHKLITQHLHVLLLSSRPSDRSFQQSLSRRGIVYRTLTGQPDTPEEEAERKRLADLFGQIEPGGKTVSEMVIEDRGPRE